MDVSLARYYPSQYYLQLIHFFNQARVELSIVPSKGMVLYDKHTRTHTADGLE